MKIKYVLALLLIAGTAFGLAEALGKVDFFAETNPAHFIKGIYIGSARTGTNRPTADVQNKMLDSRGAYFAYQFGTITAPLWQPGGCIDGPTIIKTGVLVGDICEVASDRSIWDGGRPANVKFDCEVPGTGFIKLRACAMANDAGIAVTVIDAGYYFRTSSFVAR